jgi:hypothetical protein
MPLKLMYITNDEKIAKIVENCGVDWIFIDLEIKGKRERQGHLDTVISHHNIDDVKKISSILTKSELIVRVNPIYSGSKEEINKVISSGAEIVMLPFFKEKNEVKKFIDYVNIGAKKCLLLETPEAVDNIDSILKLDDIDYIHIGLNDLHIGYGMDFMFELLADGTVEMLCNKIKCKGIPCGFGGIAKLDKGDLPAKYIIAEHYRLGSTMAILSRTFCDVNKFNDNNEIKKVFSKSLKEIRKYEYQLKKKDIKFFKENRKIVKNKISEIKRSKVTFHEKLIDNGSF